MEYTQDKYLEHSKKISLMREFFQLNDINPPEAIGLCMHFAALFTHMNLEKKQVLKMFEMIFESVLKGEK